MSHFPDISIIRSSRRTIAIQVTGNAEILVKAPSHMPQFLIHQFIDRNEEWITKRLEALKKRPSAQPKTYIPGETFLYLGQPYTLSLGRGTRIFAKEGILSVPQALSFRLNKEISEWYFKEAKRIITLRIEVNAAEMGVRYGSVYFSDTKSKWGSCSPENNLQFNWRLIMAPLLVLNYVVIHELAHTKEKNHQEGFWKIVRTYNPSYKQQIKWLKANGHSLVL